MSSREPKMCSCTGSCKSWNTTEAQWTYKDGWRDFSLLQTDSLSLGWIWFLTRTSKILKWLQRLLKDELLMMSNNRILQVLQQLLQVYHHMWTCLGMMRCPDKSLYSWTMQDVRSSHWVTICQHWFCKSGRLNAWSTKQWPVSWHIMVEHPLGTTRKNSEIFSWRCSAQQRQQ